MRCNTIDGAIEQNFLQLGDNCPLAGAADILFQIGNHNPPGHRRFK